MTLLAFMTLKSELSAAMRRVKEATLSANSDEEFELYSRRLVEACDALSKARCPDASFLDTVESVELLATARRLAFALKVGSERGELPRLAEC